MSVELWRDCSGYIGWQVSNLGRVRSKVDDYNRYDFDDDYHDEEVFESAGRLFVYLRRGEKPFTFKCPVEYLVAKAFCEQNEDYCIRHVDGDLLNCKATNLEWYTPKYDPRCDPILVEHAWSSLITWFESASEASRALGIPRANIIATLKGRQWRCYSYHMWYVHERVPEERPIARRDTIRAIHKTTRQMKWYESMREASRDLGIPVGNISRVLSGERKTAGGYLFRYEKDYYEKM